MFAPSSWLENTYPQLEKNVQGIKMSRFWGSVFMCTHTHGKRQHINVILFFNLDVSKRKMNVKYLFLQGITYKLISPAQTSVDF